MEGVLWRMISKGIKENNKYILCRIKDVDNLWKKKFTVKILLSFSYLLFLLGLSNFAFSQTFTS